LKTTRQNWLGELNNRIVKYTIERSVDGAQYSIVATIENACSYIDTGLSAGAQYFYRVKSCDYARETDCSETVGVTTPGAGTEMPIGNIKVWLKGDSGHGTGPVNYWRDQSSNRNDATRMDVNPWLQPPSGVENVIAGRYAIHFDANSMQSLTIENLNITNASGEVFFVLKTATNLSTQSRSLWGFWNLNSYPATNGSITDGSIGDYANTFTPSISLNKFHIYNIASQPDEWTARINGITQFTTKTNEVMWPVSLDIGTGWGWKLGRSLQLSHFDGDIAEIMLFDRALNEDERDVVNSYLNQRYALTDIVPTTPTNLTAKAVSPTQVSLCWDSHVTNGQTRFEVIRSTNGVSYSRVARIENGTSFVDTVLNPGTEYWYWVRALNCAGASEYSAFASVWTPTSSAEAPFGSLCLWLKADAGLNAGMVQRWRDQSGRGNDAFPCSGTNMPMMVENVANGRPVVRFSASGNQYLCLPPFLSNSAPAEAMVVWRAVSFGASLIRTSPARGPKDGPFSIKEPKGLWTKRATSRTHCHFPCWEWISTTARSGSTGI